MRGMAKLMQVVHKVQQRLNSDLSIAGVLITQYDGRKNLNKSVSELVQETFQQRCSAPHTHATPLRWPKPRHKAIFSLCLQICRGRSAYAVATEGRDIFRPANRNRSNQMDKEERFKNSMSAGLTGGLDSLIQSTAWQKKRLKSRRKRKPCIVILSWTKPITRT